MLKLATRIFLFASVLFLTNTVAASAQELPATQPAPQVSEEQRMINELPENVRNNMKPGVRYTIGSKTVAGWENQLVKGNAGLKHFFWSPVTSMVQASPSQKTSAQAISAAPQPRQEFHYVKPIKAALPSNPAAYLPPPRKAIARSLPPMRNSRDVSAKLAYKKPRATEGVSADLISTDTQAKLYADYPSYKQNASGELVSKDAYGKLLNN